jgi:glycine C-acetyltransferase
MPLNRLAEVLRRQIGEVDARGATKRRESVITAVDPPSGDRGPRYHLDGEDLRSFIRMNSNGYLGMAFHERVTAAEEKAARAFGTGPQAVRFISGTHASHVSLERRLAEFHGREAAMIFSSAYATVLGVLPSLIARDTSVISDELNHNCIINAIRLAQPPSKAVYRHLDLDALERSLDEATSASARVIVVTDGVFSMRGDHAPLRRIEELAEAYDDRCAEGVVTVVDDSHGVGALGATGRGTEEVTSGRADILVATLGKALGVNGGYVVGSQTVIDHLRETSPFYIYSNPITPSEAAAAQAALDLLDSPEGMALLDHLRAMARRLREGLSSLGLETIAGEHPVVPLLIRDTERTRRLVLHLHGRGILATGLSYPVVPRGEEEIRFQVAADHTEADIDEVLAALAASAPA